MFLSYEGPLLSSTPLQELSVSAQVLSNFLMRPENWVYEGTSINKWYELQL